jgi:hypothetical protein
MYYMFILISQLETDDKTTNANWKQVSDNFYILKINTYMIFWRQVFAL